MNNYSEELRSILKQSEILALNNGNNEVNTLHFLIATINSNTNASNVLHNSNITLENLINHLNNETKTKDYIFYSKEFLACIETIILESDELNEEITTNILLSTILQNKNTICYKVLKELNINIQNIINSLKTKDISNMKLTIKELAVDLTEQARKDELDKVIGRDKEIERVIEILARKNKNNPILIGEAGTGKTAIVEELARRIANNEVPSFLKNKTILNLNLASVIAGTKYRGEFEEKLTKIIKELETVDNLILFIDEVHTLVGAGGAEGAIDASNILKPALARGKIRVIGATTNNEYTNSIATDKALDRRFQKVIVNEPTKEETKDILKKIKKDYETYHNVRIKNSIIDKLVNLSTIYIKDRHEPDKSIDLLDEVCARANIVKTKDESNEYFKKLDKLKLQKQNFLKQEDYINATRIKNEIDKLTIKQNNKSHLNPSPSVTENILLKVLENKCSCPIYELQDNTYLSNLNKQLLNEFPNNKEQIDTLTDITKDIFAKQKNKPASILIKTQNDKLITKYAQILKLNTIKLEGNDYTTSISINKIIGSPAGYVGYNEKNTIFEKLKTYSRSIIIVNNYELINNEIQSLIQSMIKTGTLKLANNDSIDVFSCIFILLENNTEKPLGFINQEEKTSASYDYTINLNEKVLMN